MTLKLFQDISKDLDEVNHETEIDTSNQIVAHIVATMSDNTTTEIKFNNLLQSSMQNLTDPLNIRMHQ